MTDLPVNLDSTYADDAGDASVKAHQEHHDALHALYNKLVGSDAAAGTALLQALLADTFQPVGDYVESTDVTTIVQVTQAAYDLLTPDANTLYVVVG